MSKNRNDAIPYLSLSINKIEECCLELGMKRESMCIICEAEETPGGLLDLPEKVVTCENVVSIPELEGATVLDCRHSAELESIAVTPGLEELYCYGCERLTVVPEISSLQVLGMSHSGIQEVPAGLSSLVILYAGGCSITEIPREVLLNLEALELSMCNDLTFPFDILGQMTKLEVLIWNYRQGLREIPETMISLKTLAVSFARDLVAIRAPNLETVECVSCPLLVELPEYEIEHLSRIGSPWVGPGVKEKVEIIQRRFRVWKLCRGLRRRGEQITPLWWAPDAKGGFFWMKRLERIENGKEEK